MKIKSYFAASVEAAISQAKQELGEDAMLMNSRKSMPEARHLGEYEVVFACTAIPEKATPPATPSPKSETKSETRFELKSQSRAEPQIRFQIPVMPPDRLTEEIADLRKQLERMASMFNRGTAVASSNLLASPVLARLFSSLIAWVISFDPRDRHQIRAVASIIALKWGRVHALRDAMEFASSWGTDSADLSGTATTTTGITLTPMHTICR